MAQSDSNSDRFIDALSLLQKAGYDPRYIAHRWVPPQHTPGEPFTGNEESVVRPAEAPRVDQPAPASTPRWDRPETTFSDLLSDYLGLTDQRSS